MYVLLIYSTFSSSSGANTCAHARTHAHSNTLKQIHISSSLDALGSPLLRSDPRHSLHHALSVLEYGKLQEQWEKREEIGAKMVGKAQEMITELPFFVVLERSEGSHGDDEQQGIGNIKWIMPELVSHLSQWTSLPL